MLLALYENKRQHWMMTKRNKRVDLKYNGIYVKIKMSVVECTPVIATLNVKEKEIFNTVEFVIEDMSNN